MAASISSFSMTYVALLSGHPLKAASHTKVWARCMLPHQLRVAANFHKTQDLLRGHGLIKIWQAASPFRDSLEVILLFHGCVLDQYGSNKTRHAIVSFIFRAYICLSQRHPYTYERVLQTWSFKLVIPAGFLFNFIAGSLESR
ncbi:hypothetical protein P168DRAFT_78462 [Aspergillus campestris IBT 28561]|uniref:Uncharacterized protein n=1 Tax=Aspergillus campestris (strain IBT 28561) TaxID=1392248 RepID=A0A2I1CQY8_ASPC2|nr:uncharacterized protein P168DRAFT_78462 [Aspergillus campestris IBT 28561]PKY00033.1 hypothetical protein P168DRAFT_78462 [Aspergillus campestris IBT 28561]